MKFKIMVSASLALLFSVSVFADQAISIATPMSCANQKARMTKDLSIVKSLGLSASPAEINQMCEAMFIVGNDYLALGVQQLGVGWISNPNEVPDDNCVESAYQDLLSKVSSIRSFSDRCQKLVNQHPLSMSGTNDDWRNRYTIGAQALGFEFPWSTN